MASGGAGALLVSPFTMEWRCYARAGGVEESKFFLFLLVFSVRCISSISPRFYFRKHAFCFLPLVAILESFFSHALKSTLPTLFLVVLGFELEDLHMLYRCSTA
jgi:hypothetical protein